VSVTAGDITGDGVDELVTAAGRDGLSDVSVWSLGGGNLTRLAAFPAFDPSFTGPVAVAAGDLTGDGVAELVTAAGLGDRSDVRVWSFVAGQATEITGFFAYAPAFGGGVSVAAGDITGDGIADVITGAGPGGGPHVRVWSVGGQLTELAGFFAYDPAFAGGVFVAAGDVTGDGVAEFLTGAGPGGGPHVRVWSAAGGQLTELTGFYAYDPAFTGGVSVAAGDLTGQGAGQIVTGAGPGGGPHVRVIDVSGGSATELAAFFAFEPSFTGGVSVGVGDLTGDGVAELVTAAGLNGGSRVRVWSLSGGLHLLQDFFAYNPALPGAVSVGVGDVTGDGVAELVTGAGGSAPQVRVWSLANGGVTEIARFFSYDPAFPGGVSVGVGDLNDDGVAEIITGAGPGGGPHVRIWTVTGAGAQLRSAIGNPAR
jgi:glutamine cyclotransferase